MITLDFNRAAASNKPFPHALLPIAIPRDASNAALSWLVSEAPWDLRVEDFYVQHEFSLLNVALGDAIAPLASGAFIDQVREFLERTFSLDRTLHLVDVNAHRLTSKQVIRVHNDYIEGAETHRFLIQLNTGWTAAQGGLLMLFEEDNVETVRQVLLPQHGSGFAFEISPRSFHAVSEIRHGERYTLVYTFS
ncbi:cyclophane-containing peptide 2OG-Fe(II) oxygenase YhhC [Bradyrhizobium ganzhouense]|uniref:cyclophane-containing peptide 2OG-Fe(II) oxygenase YhhC n=1 Tax=Bradyrhizobium ganzhouense TaxID=1179767 RepID=UPI003CEBC52D